MKRYQTVFPKLSSQQKRIISEIFPELSIKQRVNLLSKPISSIRFKLNRIGSLPRRVRKYYYQDL